MRAAATAESHPHGANEIGYDIRPPYVDSTHRVPITFVEGARDPVPVPGRTAALAATLPHSTHRVHPDADHYLPLTHAAWCAAQIAGQIDTQE